MLQVQVDEAIGQRCDQAIDQLNKQLHDKNINVGEIRRVDDTHILVRQRGSERSGRVPRFDQRPIHGLDHVAGGGRNERLPADDEALRSIADLRTQTMDQALETITRRINALGLTEPTIAFTGRGDNEILVQLPGEGDPTRAKSVIQAGGQLQLKRVADDQTYPSEAAALAAHGGVLPAGNGNCSGQIGSAAAGQARAAGLLHSRSRSDRHRPGFARRQPRIPARQQSRTI